MVLPASRKISRVPRYLGALQTGKSFSPTGLSPSLVDPFQSLSINHLLFYCSTGPYSDHAETRNTHFATPYGLARNRFRLFPFRSPLLGKSQLLSLPEGTEMFHFPSLALLTYGFSEQCIDMTRYGLPHSEIPGSTVVCTYPRLFAAYHVLHRLPVPRHPS